VEKDKEFLNKLNALLEQNKTIAKGLTLMEQKLRERVYGQSERPQERPPMIPRQPAPVIHTKEKTEEGWIPSTMSSHQIKRKPLTNE